MARKKNNGAGTALVVISGLVLYLLSKIPRDLWILLGFVALGSAVFYVIYRIQSAAAAKEIERNAAAVQAENSFELTARKATKTSDLATNQGQTQSESGAVVKAIYAKATAAKLVPEASFFDCYPYRQPWTLDCGP